MRDWKIFALPAALVAGGVAAARLCPAEWCRDRAALLLALPLSLHGLAALLGLLFVQSRIAWLSLLMAATTGMAYHASFVAGDVARARALVTLASILIPCLVPLFFRLAERGVLTPHGLRRAAPVTAALLILLLGPVWLREVLTESPASVLRPMSAFIPLPALALLATLLGLPLLVAPRDHESPVLGPWLGFGLLAFLAGLCFMSSLWPPAKAQAALLLPMSACGLIMLLAVLESAWRHANVDELTDLPNRRALRHRLRCLGKDYVVAVLDLDHFKKVNDQHGHDVGDQVLRFVASRLAQAAEGTAYRFGGEEFVFVCEGQPPELFAGSMDQLRASIAAHPFRLRAPDRPRRKPKAQSKASSRAQKPRPAPAQGRTLTITVSIGVAYHTHRHATPQDVIQAADKALYRAKEEGRNRVCTAS